MHHASTMNVYLKSITLEILLFLFLCAFIVAMMVFASKRGWISHKVSKVAIVLTIALWLLLSAGALIDVFNINKDISQNDFVEEKLTVVTEEYNLGTLELYSKKHVHFQNESGETIKLWIRDDICSIESDFEGTVVYARRSKCIVSVNVAQE